MSAATSKVLQDTWNRHAGVSLRSLHPTLDSIPGFLPILAPLLAAAKARLEECAATRLAHRKDLAFDPKAVITLLVPALVIQMMQLSERTLALELNVARLSGSLGGADPAERFSSFLRVMSASERALALLEEYPVLAQDLINAADLWVLSSAELLERLAADWTMILAALNGGRHPGSIVEIEGSGDTHRAGRRVVCIRFDSDFRLVYKPRSLALDRHFQQLLSWLNARGAFPHFRILDVIDRGTHGWVEFVRGAACDERAQVRRFYWRQGANLAVLYALGGSDFHAENVIAEGEFPVLIDLEALFHAKLPATDGGAVYNALLQEGIVESVLRIGLLPQRSFATADEAGIDVSGLGSRPQALSPGGVPRWQGAGTDEMRLVQERVPIGLAAHLPQLKDGSVIELADYLADIETGFRQVFQLLRDHRDALFAAGGPIEAFVHDENRVVLRASRTYARLLVESGHPDLLSDSRERDRLLDRLAGELAQSPYLSRVIDAERADLQRGDIPIFNSQPGSLDVTTSEGERIQRFFSQTSLAAAQDRITRFDEPELDKQLWFIRASVASTVTAGARASADATPAAGRGADPLQLVNGARRIGDRLQDLAVRAQGAALWFGLNEAGNAQVEIGPCGFDLYSGLGGISVFLALLARATGAQRYQELAHAGSNCLRDALRRFGPAIQSIGGFDGWGGHVYALAALGSLWRDRTLLDEAEGYVARVSELIEQDAQFDVISGAAGCIGALLALYHVRPAASTLTVMNRCAEHLIANARPMDTGLGWQAQQPQAQRRQTAPLGGFAHGAGGIAWALLKLHGVTRDPRYLQVAQGAIDYERSLFSAAAGNWRDLRCFEGVETAEASYATAWCHGAPGIALARASTLHVLDDGKVRAEIRAGLATTVRQSAGGSDCLCHGALGNELIASRVRALAAPEGFADSSSILEATLTRLARGTWLCGNRMHGDLPGLLTGLAGLGYGLLALAGPESVPCVLTLEPFV